MKFKLKLEPYHYNIDHKLRLMALTENQLNNMARNNILKRVSMMLDTVSRVIDKGDKEQLANCILYYMGEDET